MQSILKAFVAASFIIAGIAGCDRHKPNQSTEDFEARLAAAMTITNTSSKDSALTTVAADAADFGAGDVVKKAVMGITSSGDRDSAAHDAALRLAKAGKRAAAREVAALITSSSTRDDTLNTLAKGKE